MIYFLLVIVIGYLLGSVSSAVLIGKTFYCIDVRELGSKNAGATNTFRVLGGKAGLIVFLFDIFKGFLAVSLLRLIDHSALTDSQFVMLQLSVSLAALMGHIFPIFYGFKGGKGISTLLGILLAIMPLPALSAFLVFLIIFFTTKYVSVGSMSAAIAFPFIVIFGFDLRLIPIIIFSSVIAVLVLLTHRKNIKRLFAGEESKTNLFKKRAGL